MNAAGPLINHEDIDAFVGRWLSRLNPSLSAEQRADTAYEFVVELLKLTEPDKSDEWITAFARRVRSRAL